MKLDSGAYRRGTVTAVDEREVEEAGDLDQGRELLEGSDARAGERESTCRLRSAGMPSTLSNGSACDHVYFRGGQRGDRGSLLAEPQPLQAGPQKRRCGCRAR